MIRPSISSQQSQYELSSSKKQNNENDTNLNFFFFFICKKMALPLIATTLFGCCSAVICLELLIQEDPGVGHLVTFCAFLFISADGLLNELQLGRKKLQVPGKIVSYENYYVTK